VQPPRRDQSPLFEPSHSGVQSFSLRRPDDKKPSSEPVPPQGGGGGLGSGGSFGGGFGGPPVPGTLTRQRPGTAPRTGGNKPGEGLGTARTPLEAEKEDGEKLKRVESLIGRDGRTGASAFQRGKEAPTAPRSATEPPASRAISAPPPGGNRFPGRWTSPTRSAGKPALVLRGGRGTLDFNLNDAVTTYQVTVFGPRLDGRSLPPRSPLEVRKPLDRPVARSRRTDGQRSGRCAGQRPQPHRQGTGCRCLLLPGRGQEGSAGRPKDSCGGRPGQDHEPAETASRRVTGYNISFYSGN